MDSSKWIVVLGKEEEELRDSVLFPVEMEIESCRSSDIEFVGFCSNVVAFMREERGMKTFKGYELG